MAGDKHEGHPQYRELGAYTAPAAPVQGEGRMRFTKAESKHIAEELCAAYQRIDELEKALRKLINETSLWLNAYGPDMRDAAGNTNFACLENRVNESREVLSIDPFPAESGAYTA